MEIKKESIVGTLESSDVMIRVVPSNDLTITINSTVAKQFLDEITNTIKNVLQQLNITKIELIVDDKGALDCVLRARLKTAIMRATDKQIHIGDII